MLRMRWDNNTLFYQVPNHGDLPHSHSSPPRLTKAQKSRLAAESRNGKEQEDIWMCTPFELYMSTNTDQKTPPPPQLPLRRLTLPECHDFCWKLCAVYMSFPEARQSHSHRVDLFHFLDGRWFRGKRTWAFCGSSFAKGNLLLPPPGGDQNQNQGQGQRERSRSPTLITTHRTLCAQVAHRQGTLDPMDAAVHGEQDARHAALKNYHLVPCGLSPSPDLPTGVYRHRPSPDARRPDISMRLGGGRSAVGFHRR